MESIEEFAKGAARTAEGEREREAERKGASDADATDTVSGACNKVNKEPVRQVDSPFGPAALLFPSAAAPGPRGPSGPEKKGEETGGEEEGLQRSTQRPVSKAQRGPRRDARYALSFPIS